MSIYDYDEKAFNKLARTFGSYSADLLYSKNQQRQPSKTELPHSKEEHPQSRTIARLFNSDGWSREHTQKMINQIS